MPCFLCVLLSLRLLFPFAEEQAYAIRPCNAYYGVYDSAEQSIASTEEGCHKIELEETDKSPVQGSYYDQDKG